MGKDELQTRMVPDRSREALPVLTGPGVMPGSSETYIAYSRAWANVSNTPFRHDKSNHHEGGIATPLIAHWPKGIAARDELRHRVGHLIDIMPTCVELAGADYPKSRNGREILPMEGASLVAGFAKDGQIGEGPSPGEAAAIRNAWASVWLTLAKMSWESTESCAIVHPCELTSKKTW